MASMLTDQQILSAVQGAFSPLRCTAEIWDHQQKLRLRVFDSSDQTVIACPEQVLGAIRNVESLRAFLEMLRAQVQTKGHRLGPLKVL
jgi:hypothetical protein